MLVGYSMGGYAVCAVLNYPNNVSAVVSFAGFNCTQEVTESQAVAEAGGVYYIISPQILAIENQLFGDTAKLTAVDGINKSNIPVMIIQCSDDEIVTNDVSIYAQRDNITNPHLEIVYLEGDDAFGHYFKYYPKEELYERVYNFLENSR